MIENIPPQVDVEKDKAPEEKPEPVWINNVPKSASNSMENGGHLHRDDFWDESWEERIFSIFGY